jgi:hypothetical protein
MARLIVQAESTGSSGGSGGLAPPGSQAPMNIIVSVERSNGLPRTGLMAANFAVDALLVAPGGALVTIDSVGEMKPGVYLIRVVPAQGDPFQQGAWQLGRYIFWIAVTAGTDRGQALCQTSVS